MPQHSGIPNINTLDHQIHLHNGSTSVLELLPQKLQATKQGGSLTLPARFEELTKEVGRQRQEIMFYRQAFENLQQLRAEIYDVSQKLFFAYYIDRNFALLDDLFVRLRDAVDASAREEFRARKIWMEFWGVQFSDQDSTRGGMF